MAYTKMLAEEGSRAAVEGMGVPAGVRKAGEERAAATFLNLGLEIEDEQ